MVISIFFGLMRFFDTPAIELPSGGFDLLLSGSAFLLAGFVPYGPRRTGENELAEPAICAARYRRTLKTYFLAGALLSLTLIVANLQRFNPPI